MNWKRQFYPPKDQLPSSCTLRNNCIASGITVCKKTERANRVLRNELFHVVIEAEVDHIEHAIASHCCRYALVQATPTKPISLYDLSSLGNSRRLLTTVTAQARDSQKKLSNKDKKIYI